MGKGPEESDGRKQTQEQIPGRQLVSPLPRFALFHVVFSGKDGHDVKSDRGEGNSPVVPKPFDQVTAVKSNFIVEIKGLQLRVHACEFRILPSIEIGYETRVFHGDDIIIDIVGVDVVVVIDESDIIFQRSNV